MGPFGRLLYWFTSRTSSVRHKVASRAGQFALQTLAEYNVFMRRQNLVVAIFFLVLALGCSGNSGTQCDGTVVDGVCYEDGQDPVIGQPCFAHVDCKNIAACVEGKCKQECTEDWQCPQPGSCQDFQCVTSTTTDVRTPPPTDTPTPPPPTDAGSGKACTSSFDCAGEGACIDGTCQKECDTDGDCPPKATCLQFQCVLSDVPDVGEPDTEPADTGKPADTATPTDTGDPLPPGCEGKKGPYGSTCACKEDCATNLCLGDQAAGKGFCTKECFTSSNCDGTDWCLDVGGGTKVCVKNDAGAPCAGGCLSTQLTNQKAVCVCTVPCTSAAECPGTMACSVAPGVANKVCVPIGDLCAIDPLICFGKCFPDLSSTYLCTAFCEAINDCPAGWTCYQEMLNGQLEQNCLPN